MQKETIRIATIPSRMFSAFPAFSSLESLYKVGKLRQRDAIMSPETQVYHDGKGHEIRHPGDKIGSSQAMPMQFRQRIRRPSHTRSNSTFNVIDMKYRILRRTLKSIPVHWFERSSCFKLHVLILSMPAKLQRRCFQICSVSFNHRQISTII